MRNFKKFVVAFLMTSLLALGQFILTAGVVWLILWCFDYLPLYSMKFVLGIYLILVLFDKVSFSVKPRD